MKKKTQKIIIKKIAITNLFYKHFHIMDCSFIDYYYKSILCYNDVCLWTVTFEKWTKSLYGKNGMTRMYTSRSLKKTLKLIIIVIIIKQRVN